MKTLLFFLPFLLIVSIGLYQDISAQEPLSYFRGTDYEITKNPDGSFTQTLGLPPFIHNGTQYIEFIFTDTGDVLQVETNHGSVQLDKTTCTFNFFNNGLINATTDTPLLSDTISAYQSTDGSTWNAVSQVNDAACVPSWNGSELTASRTHSVGNMQYKYILNNGAWKTQLEVTNTSGLNDRYFGFAQTIDLNRDTIFYGGTQRNLDNFDGTTFDRAWLETNQGKMIDFLNGFNFDFDRAFDNLNGVTIIDTGIDSSRLVFDFSYNAQILLDGQTLVYDPAFGSLSGSIYSVTTSTSASASCPSPSTTNTSGDVRVGDSGAGESCTRTALEFNISNFPSNAVVIDTDIGFTIGGATNARNCDYNPMATQPSILTATNLWNDIGDGASFISNDVTCTTNGAKTAFDLGASADTDLDSAIGTRTWWAVGIKYNSETRDASDHIQTFSLPTLSVTYNMPPDPVRNFNATTAQSTGVELEWLAGTANGGASPTYQIYRCTSSSFASCTQIASQAGTTYTDGTPIRDTGFGYYFVRTTDTLGQNTGSFPINGTLGDNCLSRYHFDWTVTDACLADNDGTVTGNTLFTNSSGHVAFDFDGSSYVTLPNESDYDFERTDVFSLVFWMKTSETAVANKVILAKKSALSSTGFDVRIDGGEHMRLSLTNTGTTNELQVRYEPLLNDDTWRHFVITYDGSSTPSGIILYINGSPVALSTIIDNLSASILNNDVVSIGAESDGDNKFTGQIDDVMIFNATLTAHDVQNLYNQRIDADGLPNSVQDLTATATSLSSVDLDWTTPTSRFYSITGYAINFTTPFGDPLTVITADTGSATTTYEVTGITVGGDYSFRTSPLTSFGQNATGNIANATTFSPFTVGELEIESDPNPSIFPVIFTETDTNSTHKDVTVRYPNTVTDFRCNLSYNFAQVNQTYTGLDTSVYDADNNQTTFTLVNATNEIITFYCWDNNDLDTDGTHIVKQLAFPFVDQINTFRAGGFGTSGSFGALDFITLIVIIVSMIGFNKGNPVVGVVIAAMVLGSTSFFGIIQLESTLFGAMAIGIMIAIMVTRK